MKFLVVLAIVAVAFAAEKEEEKKTTEKRGVASLGYGLHTPAAVGYAAPAFGLPAGLPVGYHGLGYNGLGYHHGLGYNGLGYNGLGYSAPHLGYNHGLGLGLAYDHAALGFGYGLGHNIAAYNGPIIGGPAVRAYAGPAIHAGFAAPLGYTKAGYY